MMRRSKRHLCSGNQEYCKVKLPVNVRGEAHHNLSPRPFHIAVVYNPWRIQEFLWTFAAS
jgi:hypothetical protein